MNLFVKEKSLFKNICHRAENEIVKMFALTTQIHSAPHTHYTYNVSWIHTIMSKILSRTFWLKTSTLILATLWFLKPKSNYNFLFDYWNFFHSEIFSLWRAVRDFANFKSDIFISFTTSPSIKFTNMLRSRIHALKD